MDEPLHIKIHRFSVNETAIASGKIAYTAFWDTPAPAKVPRILSTAFMLSRREGE